MSDLPLYERGKQFMCHYTQIILIGKFSVITRNDNEEKRSILFWNT